jgi:HrpA-like RNA helicase
VEIDLLLIILRQLLRAQVCSVLCACSRPHLAQAAKKAPFPVKVVLMSATLDAEVFSRYFNGAPLVSIQGRTFPVKVGRHLIRAARAHRAPRLAGTVPRGRH